MKTFEKWLNKSNYEYLPVKDSFYTSYLITGSYGKAIVSIDCFTKGGKVFDDNGYMTKCQSVKEIISLVDFLVGGEC